MDLQPYSQDNFSKILRTCFTSRNQCIIVSFLQCTLTKKLPFILMNTLLIHIPPLALTHPQTELGRDKYTCCVGAGGTFFPVVLLCQFIGFWLEIGFFVTFLCIQSTIQLWHCFRFSVLAGNSFWCYICTQCTIHLCGCIRFFVVAGNSVVSGNSSQNENTF